MQFMEEYDMNGRTVYLIPVAATEHIEPARRPCSDCGKGAIHIVLEGGPSEFTDGWQWCGQCAVGG